MDGKLLALLAAMASSAPASAASQDAPDQPAALGPRGAGPGRERDRRETVASILSWLTRSDAEASRGDALANRRTSSRAVKRFVGEVASERARILRQAERLAEAAGVSPPSAAASQGIGAGPAGPGEVDDAGGFGEVRRLRGGAFDQAFLGWLALRQQQEARQAARARAEAVHAGEPELASLLAELEEVLQGHAQTAGRLTGILAARASAGRGEGE